MRPPRPTLPIFNAEDDCFFRAPLVKTEYSTKSSPFSASPGKKMYFAGMKMPILAHTIIISTTGCRPIDSLRKLLVYQPLTLKPLFLAKSGPPRNWRSACRRQSNDTWARKKARAEHELHIPRSSGRIQNRAKDGSGKLIRFGPVTVQHAWPVGSTKNKGVDSRSYVFELSNGLCATGVWTKAITTRATCR